MNNYKGYVPNNLRWATKTDQTKFRKVTKWHDVNGKHMTTKEFAKHIGISYSCLYKRLQKGWSVQRLLDDRKKGGGIQAWQFPPELAHVLESAYAKRKSYNQSRVDWFIAWMTKRLAQIDSFEIEGVSDTERTLLQGQLDSAKQDLKVLQKHHQDQIDLEIRMMIAALSPPKVFPDHVDLQSIVPLQPKHAPAIKPGACTSDTTSTEAASIDCAAAYELEQQRRRKNIGYLAGVVAVHCPNSLFGFPWDGDHVPDDLYQRFADEAYIATTGLGPKAATDLLHEYQVRDIPMPRSELLHAALPA